ncbi:PAS domain S-box protein [Microvirga yunnanensis]|uniref:PAS domain S-box protein n=1 Tax=Microvirga yunnanensis TaxID=2953740 RepID=UPI0021C96A8B|nr:MULTISPECIES: PAS domain S-box protein [unclassified Microvirga]
MPFLTGGGTMSARIQAYDWSSSPVGRAETWPPSLRVTISNMLRSKMPTYLLWGPELITFYNDACLPLRGLRTEALGQPLRQAWAEIWDVASPLVARARGGEATYVQDVPVWIVQRKGYPEETWWNASFSPVIAESGDVGGVLIVIHETTERVFGEQRLQFLVDLSTRLRGTSDACGVMALAAKMLGRHLKASRVGYAEFSETGRSFTVERDWTEGSTPSFAGQYQVSDFGPLVESELRAGHTVHINDAQTDLLTAAANIATQFLRTGKRATIIAPLIRDNRLVAALFVHQSEPRHWRDDEVTLAQEVAERTWTSVLRARAEMALRESEARFRQFAEHSTDMLWIMNADTLQMEYVSPAFERVWGWSPEMLQHRDQWAESLHPEDRESALQTTERVLRGDTVIHEYRIVRPDGSMRHIHATGFPIFDEHQQIRRIAGIAKDITQHDGSTVYVVDSNETSRRELCLLLQGASYEVKTFASAQSFLEVAPVLVPGSVVLDVRNPETGELTIPREVKVRRSSLPTIVIGEARGDVAVGVRAMKAGAVDFLDVPYAPEQLLDALASAQATIRERAERDQATERVRALIAALPAREREVLDGLLAGGTNKTIARDLGLSPRTVEAHRARIMERLGAQSLPELVQIAVAAGLQPKPPDG